MHKFMPVLFLATCCTLYGQLPSAPGPVRISPVLAASVFTESSSLSGDGWSESTNRTKTDRIAVNHTASLLAHRSAAHAFARFMEKPGSQYPVSSLAETATFVQSGEIGGSNHRLLGWTVTPEVNFSRHLALQADFTSLYVQSIYPGQTRLAIAAGPRFNFAPASRVSPFVFAEGGEIRRSTKANVIKDWNPIVKAGFGVDYKIVRGFGIDLIPAEYIGQHNDDSTWLHSFSARAGIVFNLYR
jgi:hypothetical protein